MYDPSAVFYMEKLVTGPAAADVVDIEAPIADNLAKIAKAKSERVEDLTVVILDRPRHEGMVSEIREAGARIKFITDGDVAGAIMAARDGTGIDLLVGIGGTPEGVITACAIKCIGGVIQGKLWPKDDEERAAPSTPATTSSACCTTDDLVTGDNVFFVATGITDGELIEGVRFKRRHDHDALDRHAQQERHDPRGARASTRWASCARTPRSTSTTPADPARRTREVCHHDDARVGDARTSRGQVPSSGADPPPLSLRVLGRLGRLMSTPPMIAAPVTRMTGAPGRGVAVGRGAAAHDADGLVAHEDAVGHGDVDAAHEGEHPELGDLRGERSRR